MDLTVIKGLGPARRTSLEDAGISDIDALSKADPAALSEEVGISDKLLTDFKHQAEGLVALRELDGVGPANLAKLAEADVRSLSELTQQDIPDLHEATGITTSELKRWKRQAGPKAAAHAAKATADSAQAAAREIGEKALERWSDARVVLHEGIEDARVKLDDEVLAEVRVLPIRAKDNVEKVLERVKGNVVLLREEAETAVIRVEERVHEGLPIFKEKVAQAQDEAADQAREVRVRVQEIRDKRVLPKAEQLKEKVKSLFGKSS